MKLAAAAVLAVAMATVPAHAQKSKKIVGDWMVEIERDRFADTQKATAFVMRGTTGFGVRCLSDEPSFALAELARTDRFPTGTMWKVKVRVDDGSIIDGAAGALSDSMLEIVMTRPAFAGVLREMRGGLEVALRLESDVMKYDRVFRIRGAREALAPIIKACKLEE